MTASEESSDVLKLQLAYAVLGHFTHAKDIVVASDVCSSHMLRVGRAKTEPKLDSRFPNPDRKFATVQNSYLN